MVDRAKVILVFLLFIGAVVSSYFALETYITAKLVEKFSKRIREFPFDVSCSEIDYSLLKNTITYKDVNTNILGMNISVKTVEIDLPFTARKKELPDHMLIKVVGLEFPSSLIGITTTSRTVVNLVTGYSFGKDSLRVILKTSIPSLWDLSLICKLKNLSKEKLEKALAGVISERRTIRETKIEYLALRYRDRGFVSEYLKQGALEKGITAEEFKKELIELIDENTKEDKVLTERIGQPLIKFLENPRCIDLIVHPVLPVSLKELSHLLNSHSDLKKITLWLGVTAKTCD